MKKLVAVLLTLAMVVAMGACAKTETTQAAEDINKKSEGVMTYAEYQATEADKAVVIEGYIQGYAYNATYNNVCFFLQDGDGAYYTYRTVCDAEQGKNLAVGKKVKVTGFKAEWSGEVEVAEGATFEFEDGSYTATALDVTSMFGTDALAAEQNKKVAVKGAEVVASVDADKKEVAFLYNWDGSGQKGANNDLYFNVKIGDATYSFTVESDECAEGTDVYTKVTELKIGDKIDLEGFLYWYNGAQLHVNSVTVK